MSFSVGIVGLPNVGKSTLFKALTKKQVDTSNYPFATIDPNVGVVAVPDDRLEKLTIFSESKKTVPTVIEFYDIAGLVKGAHKGEGLGNKFLSHIGEVDAIAHVVRTFTDANVIHVEGKTDPISDIETINLELLMADHATVQKRIEATEGKLRSGDKEAKMVMPVLQKLITSFNEHTPARKVSLTDDERELIKDLNLLTLKPMIYVLNVAEDQLKDIASVRPPEIIANEPYVVISAKIESELAELPPEEAKEYLKELGLERSGLEALIQTCYRLLNLITFLTTGPDETRAWTVTAGATAPQAAGRIHTDFEKGFIKAEVINWQDLLNAGSEPKAKEKGLIRIEGKEYVMEDGDTVFFHTNA